MATAPPLAAGPSRLLKTSRTSGQARLSLGLPTVLCCPICEQVAIDSECGCDSGALVDLSNDGIVVGFAPCGVSAPRVSTKG